MSAPTLELWQTEWCPASHRVRQRLTELGLTCTVHQVPVERDARAQLEHATGRRAIPTLVAAENVIDGEPAILAYLDSASRSRRTRNSSAPRRPGQSERNWRRHVPS
jgi:glutathione S-transferase